jgi:hypothetical protein
VPVRLLTAEQQPPAALEGGREGVVVSGVEAKRARAM